MICTLKSSVKLKAMQTNIYDECHAFRDLRIIQLLAGYRITIQRKFKRNRLRNRKKMKFYILFNIFDIREKRKTHEIRHFSYWSTSR